MVGYDAASILIRNSWTPMWGESGYIRLKRTTECGSDEHPSDGTGCNNGPKTVSVCGQCGVLYDTSYPTGTTTA
jgi:cathepsin L